MNFENIPPGLLQQLMSQLNGMNEEAELPEEEQSEEIDSDLIIPPTPLSDSTTDLILIKYLAKDLPISETQQDYFTLYLQAAFTSQSKTSEEVLKYLDLKYKNYKTSNGICGMKMGSLDVAYSCLDCQMDPTCIICKTCFENGNHKGHRFQIRTNVSGMCDCGDPEAWKAHGNCKDHSGFLQEDNILDEQTKRKMIVEFKRFIYYLVQMIELNPKNKNVINNVSKLFHELITGVIKLKERYVTLVIQFGKAFCETYKQDFEGVKNWHDCTSAYEENTPTDMTPCDCTVLRSLLRVNVKMSIKTQNLFNEFCMLMFIDYKFKQHLAIEFVRMVNYQINWERIGKKEEDKLAVSKLLSISIQIMTSEQLALDAIEQAGIRNMLMGLQKLVPKYIKPDGYLSFDDQFINQIWMNVHYTLMKRSAIKKVFEDRESLRMLFQFFEEVIRNCPRTLFKLKGVDLNMEESVVQSLYFEITMMRHFTEFISSLWSQDIEGSLEGYFNFFKEAKESIYRLSEHFKQNQCLVEQTMEEHFMYSGEFIKKSTSYAVQTVMTVQRLFVQSMVPFLFIEQKGESLEVVEFSNKKLEKFNEEVFTDGDDCRKFWEVMTEFFSGVVGFQREFSREVWSFYGPLKQRYAWLYYNFKIHNLDVVALQLCAINLPENFTKLMWENYPSPAGKHYMENFIFQQKADKIEQKNEKKRVKDVVQSIGDFLSYQIEINTNQHNILWILDQYVEFNSRIYEALRFTGTNAGKMESAKQDILLSMMSSVPPTQVKDFMKYISQHIEDKEVINAFLKTKATINRDKRTVVVNREFYMASMGKIYKSVQAFNDKKVEQAKISIADVPYSSMFWYDPFKSSEAFEEIGQKQIVSARDFCQVNNVTGQLKELIEANQIFFYPFRHTQYIKSVDGQTSAFLVEFIEKLSGEVLVHFKPELNQLFRVILMSLDMGNYSKDLISATTKLIKNLEEHYKSNDVYFRLFTVMFNVLGSQNSQEQELKDGMMHEQKIKDMEQKKKMLVKRKKTIRSKMQDRMSSFLAKLEENAEEMLQELVEGGGIKQQGEVINCVVSNQEIQDDSYHYTLTHMKFSNVLFLMLFTIEVI